jgi:hypothetical protein
VDAVAVWRTAHVIAKQDSIGAKMGFNTPMARPVFLGWRQSQGDGESVVRINWLRVGSLEAVRRGLSA